MLNQVLIALLSIFTLIHFSVAQPDRSPEEKVYRAALQMADPQQRIAALESYLANYAQGTYRVLAQRTILELFLESASAPPQILAQANRLLATASDNTRGNWANTIAGMLLEKGVLLEEAERFAQESVAQLGSRKNLGEMQQIAAGAGRIALASNVPRVATLGRIYLKRGKLKEAEALLKEAFAADSTLPGALLGMGELAAAKGDHKAALNYFAEAYLSGRGREAARQRVEVEYHTVYPTKPAEFATWLDAKYQKEYPNPLKAGHYKPTAARTNRIVLAEVFTGASCVPCVAADLAFEAALERYTTKELVVLMYHVHIPDVDPLANPTAEARKEFYDAKVAPSPYLNGMLLKGMGGNRFKAEESWAKLIPVLEKGLEYPAEAALRFSAMRQGPIIKVKVGVEKIRSAATNLRLQLALVEDQVRYTGVNGLRVHPMVVRAMTDWAVKASETPSFEHTFEVRKIEAEIKAYLDDYEQNGRTLPVKFDEKKHEIDVNNLSLVAFLQDQQTKQILQAIYMKIPAAEKIQ